MESKVKNYDGSGEVKVFLEKISLYSALKRFEDQKAAKNLASKLEGRAFDVYLRLSTEDRKQEQKMRAELLKEFERDNKDREEAIHELNKRKRKPDESAHTYSYQLIELVRLAYATFEEDAIKTIAKDYFVRGIHPKMQVALKSLSGFDKATISNLAMETTRLQLAGIESFSKSSECMSVDRPDMIDAIAEKVIEKLQCSSLGAQGIENGGEAYTSYANFAVERPNFQRNQRNRSFAKPQQRPNTNRSRRACRSCKSTDHFFRSCPTCFCQACGTRGHDAWDRACPSYQ